MIDRTQIEKFLQANGVPPSADDEEIRSLLLSAKWGENEVDTALTILRQNKFSEATHVETLHKVFHTDESLSPQEITSLLGIDVDMSASQAERREYREARPGLSDSTKILIGSILIAVVSLGFFMYSLEIGPFYVPNADIYNATPPKLLAESVLLCLHSIVCWGFS